MSKWFGRNEDRLADLGVRPPDRFTPPPMDQCAKPVDTDMDIGDGRIIHVVQVESSRRLVFFSLQLDAMIEGVRQSISRIDSKHGEIHQHFYRRGIYDAKRPRELIAVIPVDNPSRFLDDAYVDAFDTLVDNAESLIEGWH